MKFELNKDEHKKSLQALRHYRFYVNEKLNDCMKSFYPEMRNSIPNLQIELAEIDSLIQKMLQPQDDELVQTQLVNLISKIGEKSEGMHDWIRSVFNEGLESEEFKAAVLSVVNDYYRKD